jgi:hypothetical protein
MPVRIAAGNPTIVIRREAFERVGLTRLAIDERYNLTDEEFRVEADLIVVGPLPGETDVAGLIEELERVGLEYFEEFFELSGNWPEWLGVFAMSRRESGGEREG